MREVARGDKPYLRKSTDRKAQIRKAFGQFSGQSLFLFPIVFGINLDFHCEGFSYQTDLPEGEKMRKTFPLQFLHRYLLLWSRFLKESANIPFVRRLARHVHAQLNFASLNVTLRHHDHAYRYECSLRT